MKREFYRRRLPHWYPPGATLFITMRLAGSLPAGLMRQLSNQLALARERAADEAEKERQVVRTFFSKLDTALDAPAPGSPRWLESPQVQRLVLDSLHWLAHRGDFTMLAACVMPNHLHIVLELPGEPERAFEQTLRDFKQYTAVHANRSLGRNGAFWQPESFDRLVRDAGDGAGLTRCVDYVLHNPVKAGLCEFWEDWPSTWRTPLAGH